MQPASAGGSVRLAMSSVYATSKCMLDYYRKGNMARDEPQLVRAYGRKNFDPVIKEWKWPDFGNVTITLARTEGLDAPVNSIPCILTVASPWRIGSFSGSMRLRVGPLRSKGAPRVSWAACAGASSRGCPAGVSTRVIRVHGAGLAW